MQNKQNKIFRTPSPITMGHNILVGIPTSESKNYCFPEFSQRIRSISYKPHDVIFADNSQDHKNKKMLISEGFNTLYIKPKNRPIQLVIAETHEAIRQHFLRGKWSHLLHVESDIMVTPDIIERLLIHNKPIVSAVYFINQGTESNAMIQILEGHGDIREVANIKDGADMNMMDGKLHEVFSHGLGACLIRRDVLEQVPFRWDGGDIFPDTYWSFDTNAHGFPKFIDTSLILDHQNVSWTNQLLTNSIYK